MSRTRIARPKARPLKGSARDRARRCFAWFTFVRDRLQAAVVGRKPLIDESVLDLRYAGPVSKRCVCQIDFWVKFREAWKCSAIGCVISAHNLSGFDRNFIRGYLP